MAAPEPSFGNNVLINESYMQAIANAIRSKNGSASTYLPSAMAAAISAIPSGSLPTGIARVAAGSFTPATDLENDDIRYIQHNLGVGADLLALWNNETSTAPSAHAQAYSIRSYFLLELKGPVTYPPYGTPDALRYFSSDDWELDSESGYYKLKLSGFQKADTFSDADYLSFTTGYGLDTAGAGNATAYGGTNINKRSVRALGAAYCEPENYSTLNRTALPALDGTAQSEPGIFYSGITYYWVAIAFTDTVDIPVIT